MPCSSELALKRSPLCAGCCYDPAAASVGNGGATEALPACFTYNTGSSSYSFAAASNGANSGSALCSSWCHCSFIHHLTQQGCAHSMLHLRGSMLWLHADRRPHGHSTPIARTSQAAGMAAGTLSSVAGTQPELGADISNLQVTVTDISPSILRVTIGASGRWTVPQGDIFQNVAIASGSPPGVWQLPAACNVCTAEPAWLLQQWPKCCIT